MTPLSASFYLEEFQRSQTAARMGRPIFIPPEFQPNVQRLVDDVMQPVRAFIGKPIQILSGYRPPWLNAAVGGARNSQHLTANACDFVVSGLSVADVCRAVVNSGVPFDQLIHEFGEWCHVSVAPAGVVPRRSILTALRDGGVTIYRPGIPKE